MRDLTKWFYQNKPEETQAAAALLLSIDANVLAKGGVALAGGYLRDLYFGHQPKDMDFVFYGLTVQEFHAAVSMWAARVPGELTWTVFDGDYNGADRIIPAVIKVVYEGREMDFILYDCPTLAGVMYNFDHTVNMFSARYNSEYKFELLYHSREWGVCTRNANTTCTDERAARMQELSRQIDWEYVGMRTRSRYICTVCGADSPGRVLRCHECLGGPVTMQEVV